MQPLNHDSIGRQCSNGDAYDALPPSSAAAATATIAVVAADAPMKKRGGSAGGADDGKAYIDARGYLSGSKRSSGRRAGGGGSFSFIGSWNGGGGGGGGGRHPSSRSPAAAAAARALLRPLLRLPRPVRLLLLLLLLLLVGALLLVLLLPSGGGGGSARAAAREEAAALAARLYHVADGLVHTGAAAPYFASANGALKDVRVSPLRSDRAYRREAAAALPPPTATAAERQRRRRQERDEELLLRRVVEECARGEETAIWLDAARGAVLSQPLRGAPMAAGAAKDAIRGSLAEAAAFLGASPPTGGDSRLYSNRSVVRLEAAAEGASGLDPRHCPPLDVMLRGQERGAGMCADVALYVLRAGARIVPMPPTREARAAYDAQCGRRTARMFLESMYREFFYGSAAAARGGDDDFGGGESGSGGGGVGGGGGNDGKSGSSASGAKDPQQQQPEEEGAPSSPPPASGVLHLHLLNSEHMWARDARLHARVDAFLCKTRFCERLARAHVRRKGLRAAVWFVGHTSGDPTVGTLPRPPVSDPAQLAFERGEDEDEDEDGEEEEEAGGDAAAAGNAALSSRASASSLRRRRASREREMHRHLRSVGALHVKGKSGLKHTDQLLECWGRRPDLPRLVVVGRLSLKQARVGGALRAANVVFFPTVRGSERYVAARRPDYAAVARLAASGGLGEEAARLMLREDEEGQDRRRRGIAAAASASAAGNNDNSTLSLSAAALGAAAAAAAASATTHRPMASFEHIRSLQSRAPVHVCVSEREGFGHYLNEARAAGGLVITTDHAPMSELVPPGVGLLVRPERTMSYDDMALRDYARINAVVRAADICAAVDRALSLGPREVARRRAAARRAFELGRADFRARVGDLALFLRARAADATRHAVAGAGGSGALDGPPLV